MKEVSCLISLAFDRLEKSSKENGAMSLNQISVQKEPSVVSGSVASTKFNRFQLIKFKCQKINSIENQHFIYLSDSIFLKEKQKNSQMRQNHN